MVIDSFSFLKKKNFYKIIMANLHFFFAEVIYAHLHVASLSCLNEISGP